MGRVRQPQDLGTPGKFYFEHPVLTIIQGKKSNVPAGTVMSNVINMSAGRCRLESSHKMHGYAPPNDIVYEMSQNPDFRQVTDYLRKMDIAGFGEGAVVCRRYQQPFRWKYPSQWGIIIIAHKHNGGGKYAPYTVKWFSEMIVETAWAEDLVVIHANLSEPTLADILEAQGIQVESSE